ncbi:MAG TPA: phosphonate ABC transporter, permease protein PhnE [bacterium]|nr:phosphonate ABC transporter, permease protein PhnE [bacterium]
MPAVGQAGGAPDASAARSDPTPRRPGTGFRSWRFYLMAAAVLTMYVYGWQVTQIHLSELWRGAPLIAPFARALASPDVVVRDNPVERVAVAFYYGGETPPVSAAAAGPTLRLSRYTGAIGDRVIATGRGFAPGRRGVLWWENQIGQRQQLGPIATDAQGRFTTTFTAPEVQGTHNLVSAEIVAGVGPIRPSPTFYVVLGRMVETVFLALMGTTMGVIFAVPFSFLGAKNLIVHFPGGKIVYGLTRTFFNIMRSIEALVLAIIFTVWVGLGPFAGVLALGVHSIASLGKLYSEAIESIDAGPIEAIMATGADTLQVVRYGVVPQVVPQFIAFTIYRWDINVRFSTVIGFVGGGGIGFVLQQYINLLQWRQAATALWMIAIVVAVLDYASAVVRERVT